MMSRRGIHVLEQKLMSDTPHLSYMTNVEDQVAVTFANSGVHLVVDSDGSMTVWFPGDEAPTVTSVTQIQGYVALDIEVPGTKETL